MPHPFRDVAIVGVHNTVQARNLPDHDSASIALEGALGALADAGLTPGDVDAVFERLISLGHAGPLAPFDAPWGQRYATVEDPDGTSVDLFAPSTS